MRFKYWYTHSVVMKKRNGPHFFVRFATVLFALVMGVLVGTVIFLLMSPSDDQESSSNDSNLSSESKIDLLAQQIYTACRQEVDSWKCYERDIPKLMDEISMTDAFKVVYEVQNLDGTYQYCHTLGHALSAREVQKDPSKWKEVANMCPSGVCSNGCIHGGFQERFRDLDLLSNMEESEQEFIIEELKSLCESKPTWNPTPIEQSSCYHAIGHLTMYLTFADTKDASDICDEVALKEDGRDFRSVCYDGVFMQIFQPLEDEDFALIKGKEVTKTNLRSFCNAHSGARRASCLSEAWPLYREELQDARYVEDFCSMQEDAHESRCYIAITWMMTAQTGFDLEKMNEYCKGYPEIHQSRCYADVVARMLETDYRNVDRVPGFCSSIENEEHKESCNNELVRAASYNFPKGSEDAKKLCSMLASPWREQCAAAL